MMDFLSTEWNRLVDTISKVHNEPVFLPQDFIMGTLVPAVLITAVILTISYVICFSFVDNIVGADASPRIKSKMCYQIVNVAFNIVIGATGLYLEYVRIPSLPISIESPVDKILGWENELYMVSALQLGYQMWSLPVGLFYVKESFEMIAHHCAVVVSVVMTGFLSIGFRYYTPFFYGVMEISSIPLSVMNTLKENKELSEKFPSLFPLSRTLFALSFVLIRNILCLSRWPVFLRDNFVVMYTKEWGIYKGFMILQFTMAFFLNFLQLYWGSLIAKAILEMVIPPKKSEAKESDKKVE